VEVIMLYTIEEIQQLLKPLIKKYEIKNMYLFGSYARGEADENSDLDFAVDIEATKLIGLNFFIFQDELANLFEVPVDIITLNAARTSRTRFKNRFTPKFEKDKVMIA
jgi:predicted nucleotidyltransferase